MVSGRYIRRVDNTGYGNTRSETEKNMFLPYLQTFNRSLITTRQTPKLPSMMLKAFGLYCAALPPASPVTEWRIPPQNMQASSISYVFSSHTLSPVEVLLFIQRSPPPGRFPGFHQTEMPFRLYSESLLRPPLLAAFTILHGSDDLPASSCVSNHIIRIFLSVYYVPCTMVGTWNTMIFKKKKRRRAWFLLMELVVWHSTN